jgi:hypothetical protein
MRGSPRVGAGADVVARACAGPVTCVCTYIIYYIYISYYIYYIYILYYAGPVTCVCVHISYIIYTFHITYIYILGITYVYILKKILDVYKKKKLMLLWNSYHGFFGNYLIYYSVGGSCE